MNKILEVFGSKVFNDAVMRERLPKEIYKSLRKTISEGKNLDVTMANVVAHAMKEWALENGATHYTHWFQPMTGITAEKHDSFIISTENGGAATSFTWRQLIKGEPDASSFPSGGLRATFEARGYTAWDPTSYAFIKDDTLCIPTVFCSYGGEVLDKKTPLLRSMEALNKQVLRITKLFGMNEVVRAVPTVGAEQEYFLVDEELYKKRKDLVFTGRTILGASAPKGQEMGDHYFGTIKPRVAAFMRDLDKELWKLGIYAKTEHNEGAPAQHELAPLFEDANTATDHNQLTMEMMKKVAKRHGLACLLHEKPFQGVNGSGKHNNWSISTNTGVNLFDPGEDPYNNLRFLLFFTAVIKGVDEYQDLLRLTTASAGNDCRLGGHEAPPAIISMCLGDDLYAVLEAIERGEKYDPKNNGKMDIGVKVLPDLPRDGTDRNRTSPFAFTGNKFEFRMPGSALSIADPNTALNAIVAEALCQFADRLEKAEDFENEVRALLKETVEKHKRILFNGNNYSEEWVKEAERRGLLNLKSTADAIGYYVAEKNIALFEKHNIFTRSEIFSRCEIEYDNYCKIKHIEALIMVEMAKKEIVPAVSAEITKLAGAAEMIKSVGGNNSVEVECVKQMSAMNVQLYKKIELLEKAMVKCDKISSNSEKAEFYRDSVIPAMDEVRKISDELEKISPDNCWPIPTYAELLFNV
ncbi:MAG: glutamine synthetase type III [Ruminococcaceae bacterium]|nr:glutamine synthetase type III [Oscillospiraceae bacterium]